MAKRSPQLSMLEALLSIGTGAALEPISGLAGLATLPFGLGKSKKSIEDIQNLAYKPSDPTMLNALGKGLAAPMGAYDKATTWMGDNVQNATGSAALGTATKVSPEILGGLFGVRQLLKQPGRQIAQQPALLDEPDLSRRSFVRDAGLLGAGAVAAAALPKTGLLKGLMEVPAPAIAVAKGLPKVLPTSSYLQASYLQSNPDVLKAILKNGQKEVFPEHLDGGSEFKVYNDAGEEVGSFDHRLADDAIEAAASPEEFKLRSADFEESNYDKLEPGDRADVDAEIADYFDEMNVDDASLYEYLFGFSTGDDLQTLKLHPKEYKSVIKAYVANNPKMRAADRKVYQQAIDDPNLIQEVMDYNANNMMSRDDPNFDELASYLSGTE